MDIVQRLRHMKPGHGESMSEVMMQAAAEIEQLRADRATMLTHLQTAISLLGGEPDDFAEVDQYIEQAKFFEDAGAILKRHGVA